MKTNKKTRSTMPQSWIDFFNYAKDNKFEKYFPDDGNKCCAYSPEHDCRRVVQVARRRSKGKEWNKLSEKERNGASKVFGKDEFILNYIYISSSPLHGGAYIYDKSEMDARGYTLDKNIVYRNDRPYYEIPLEYCYKMLDLWDIPKKFSGPTLYKIARWQYEQLIQTHAYDYIDTWEDLPDYVFWKYFEYDGSIIEGREEQAKAYIEKSKKDARYIPVYEY